MIARRCRHCSLHSEDLFDIWCPVCGYRLVPIRVSPNKKERDS